MRPYSLLLAALIACPGVRAQDVQTFEDELTSGLPTRENGARYRDHVIHVGQPVQLLVRLFSEEFDTFLFVRSPTGLEWENDDFDGTQVSQLDFWAFEPGPWIVRATSYSDSGRGDYRLEVAAGGPVAGEVLPGRLDPWDERLPKGEVVDRHTVTLEEGSFLIAELYVYGFDGVLSIQDPQGVYHRNDDASEGVTTLSRVGPLPTTGTYQVAVTSIRGDAYGAYDLRLFRIPRDYEVPTLAPVREIRELGPGMRVVRGPAWQWGDQDEGGVGVVEQSTGDGWWQVEWDGGGRNSYRWGVEGNYDLRIISPVLVEGLELGDSVLVRPDIADFEEAEALFAFSSHVVTVVGVEDGMLIVTLPTGEEAHADPQWVEEVRD